MGMIFCEKCRRANNWPEATDTHRSRCEVCGYMAQCHSVPVARLQAQVPVGQALPVVPSGTVAQECRLDSGHGDVARALHRIVRAMHDGHCPSCGYLGEASKFVVYPGTAGERHECPKCRFHITGSDAEAALAEFLPYLQRSLAVYLAWREAGGANNPPPAVGTGTGGMAGELEAAVQAVEEAATELSGLLIRLGLDRLPQFGGDLCHSPIGTKIKVAKWMVGVLRG